MVADWRSVKAVIPKIPTPEPKEVPPAVLDPDWRKSTNKQLPIPPPKTSTPPPVADAVADWRSVKAALPESKKPEERRREEKKGDKPNADLTADWRVVKAKLPNEPKKLRGYSNLYEGGVVFTRYGNGKIKQIREADSSLVVLLEFGAMAYLR